MSYIEYFENLEKEEKEQPDQEKILNNLLLLVKTHSQHMKNSIYNNKLKNSLKYAKEMLNTLRTNDLNPENYYQLYMSIFDEMIHLLNYFKEELRRGRIMEDFYNTVQQCDNIIPRIFLLICVGVPYIESQECENPFDIINDIFNLMKGVQNPLRGLFCRYFFLQMLKDKFNDCKNSNIYIIKLILQNLEEMNFLWIRLSQCDVDVAYTTTTQREKLKYLIGDNITRLASLNFVNLQMYSKIIFPKIIEIALDSNDHLSQKYLIEFTIHAFPDEYNIPCINSFIDIFNKLDINLDPTEIMISLMEKLTKYISSNTKDDIKFLNNKIFLTLKNNVEKIIFDSKNDFNLEKLLHLSAIFMNFIIKCSSNEEEIIKYINIILNNCLTVINKNKMVRFLNLNITNLILNILELPLDEGISLFKMENYSELIPFLDYCSKKEISLKIISSLVSQYTKKNIALDTTEKALIILKNLRPLLEDEKKEDSFDDNNIFEDDQLDICKLLFIIKNDEPEIIFDILTLFKNAFIKVEKDNKKFLISSLVDVYISFILNLHKNFLNNKDKNIDNEAILSLINKIFNQIDYLINNIEDNYPDVSFKLYLTISTKIIQIKNYENKNFNDICYNNILNSIQILSKKSKNLNDNIKPNLVNELIGSILIIANSPNSNIFSLDQFNQITQEIINICQNIEKQNEKCILFLNCSNLFYNSLIKDNEKISECLTKAKKMADFSMTNPKNCILFIKIINKYIFFEEKRIIDNSFNFVFVHSKIEELFELVKNHIQNMKNEKIRPDFLGEIEEYYSNTLLIFEQMKKGQTN